MHTTTWCKIRPNYRFKGKLKWRVNDKGGSGADVHDRDDNNDDVDSSERIIFDVVSTTTIDCFGVSMRVKSTVSILMQQYVYY